MRSRKSIRGKLDRSYNHGQATMSGVVSPRSTTIQNNQHYWRHCTRAGESRASTTRVGRPTKHQARTSSVLRPRGGIPPLHMVFNRVTCWADLAVIEELGDLLELLLLNAKLLNIAKSRMQTRQLCHDRTTKACCVSEASCRSFNNLGSLLIDLCSAESLKMLGNSLEASCTFVGALANTLPFRVIA